jgi:hypothetical protein
MSERLPNIRVISVPVANVILLQSIGARLRSYYGNPASYPMPSTLTTIIDRLG